MRWETESNIIRKNKMKLWSSSKLVLVPCVFSLILTEHIRHRPMEQSDWAAGYALTWFHEEAAAHSEELCGEQAKVYRPRLSQTLPWLPFPRWLWAQQTQRWEPAFLHGAIIHVLYVSIFGSLNLLIDYLYNIYMSTWSLKVHCSWYRKPDSWDFLWGLQNHWKV